MLTMVTEQTFGERLKQLLKDNNMNQTTLAAKSGVDREYINQIINKNKNVGILIAQKLANGLGITVSELIGESSGIESDAVNKAANSIIDKVLERYETVETIRVPIRGVVPAGIPTTQEEVLEGYVFVPKSDLAGTSMKDVYAVKVFGDSLIGDGINSGDLVLVDPNAQIVDGKIYIVRLGSEVVARHVIRTEDKLILKPSNGHYEDIEVNRADILGRVFKSGGNWIDH